MNVDKLKALFTQVSQISRHCETIAKLSGEDFNVFRTLNIESSEVRMHSAFLAEFLNPQGAHGQGDRFLRLFVEQFGISNFDTKLASAEVEKYIGPINADYTEGGRIDILLTDRAGNHHIIIENKIYAGDQDKQLLRYYNFDEKAPLFYLTLNGDEPTDGSTGGKLKKDQYKVISYHTDIVQWLEECRKEAVSLPIIRETIAQYTNLIRYLTNQTTRDKMNEEIKEFIKDNPEYVDSIDKCFQALDSIITETERSFKEKFNELFPPYTIPLSDGMSIRIEWGEDGDGVFFGYRVMEGDENISGLDKAKKYAEVLEKINNGFHASSSSRNFIGWFNPKPFTRGVKFKNYDKKEIIKMYADNTYLESFIKGLIQKEKEIREDILKRIGMNL